MSGVSVGDTETGVAHPGERRRSEPLVDEVHLGASGLRVSRLCLGCMSFGEPTPERPWTLDDEAGAPIFQRALEHGITFWDTANSYAHGTSEEIVGRAIVRYATREEIVLATKVFSPMHDGPGGAGLSRKAIFEQVDASLRRLGTDYVDLLQIHRFDPDVPVRETMEALHDVVKSGRARYLGASSMWAWQFAKLQASAERHSWTRFISMQDQYSLMQREEEREMFGLLADQGVGAMPWRSLAAGVLARPWGSTESARSTTVPSHDPSGRALLSDADRPIVDAVQRVAQARGATMAVIALAWVLRNPVVTAPVIGATRVDHLDDAVAALGLSLTADEVAELEAPYTAREPTWFR